MSLKVNSVIIILLLIGNDSNSIESKSKTSSKAFSIQRSKDINEIVYEVSITGMNLINIEQPINIYWVKHTDGNRIEPLSWIQNKYAYGLEFMKKNALEATFHFVSYNKRIFTIQKDKEGQFKVYTEVKGKKAIVERIFVQIDGGSFWFPKISRVELYSLNPQNNQKVTEIIIP